MRDFMSIIFFWNLFDNLEFLQEAMKMTQVKQVKTY